MMSIFPDNDFWDSHEALSASPSKVFYRLQPDGSLEYVPPQGSWITVTVRPWFRKSACLTFLRTTVDHIHVDSWLRRMGVNIAPGVPLEKSMRWSEWGVYLADHPEPWPEVYQTTLACIKSAYFLSKKAGAKFAVMLIGPAATIERRWDEAFASY